MMVAPERARDELDGGNGGRVLAVEDRVHLDDLERAGETRLGDQLHREVRLAVGQPAAHGRPHTRRDLGVENVHIERDVDEALSGDVVERLAHRPLDADPVDLAHREHPHSGLAQELPLAGVRLPQPEQRDASRIQRRQRPGVARERVAGDAQRRRERHPVHVPTRARLGRVDVRMGVDPEGSPDAVHAGEAAESSERDRVVAAENEGRRSGVRLLDHLGGDAGAGLLDLGQEPRALVMQRRRFGHGRLDVAVVSHGVAEAHQTLLEPRITDRRRPHVHAAAALPEVECGPDHRDLTSRAHRGNLTTLSRRGEVAQLVEHTAENRGVAGSSPALAITAMAFRSPARTAKGRRFSGGASGHAQRESYAHDGLNAKLKSSTSLPSAVPRSAPLTVSRRYRPAPYVSSPLVSSVNERNTPPP